MKRLGIICAGGLLVLACTPPDSSEPTGNRLVVADSAGVRIVEAQAPRFPDGLQFRVGDEPELTIGNIDDPDQIFGFPLGARRLSDGRILVLDGQSLEILVFGPTGERLDTWGGRGDGPGEFQFPRAMFRASGDTIAVMDLATRRTTYLAPDGELVGTWTTQFDFDPRAGNLMAAQSCCVPLGAVSSDLAIWRYPMVWPRDGSGRRDVVTTVIRARPDGLDTLGTFLAGHAGDWPDGTNPVVRERFTGRFSFALSEGGRAALGSGLTFGYDVVDLETGDLLQRVRASKPLREVTPDFIAEVDEAEAAFREGTSPERLRQLARRPVADSAAAYELMNASPSGEVWLRQYAIPPIQTSNYEVFAPGGDWLGSLELPGGSVIFDLGDDYVLRWTQSELDVPLIELWRIGPVQ